MDGFIGIMFFISLAALIISIRAIRKADKLESWVEQLIQNKSDVSVTEKQAFQRSSDETEKEVRAESILQKTSQTQQAKKTSPESASYYSSCKSNRPAAKTSTPLPKKTTKLEQVIDKTVANRNADLRPVKPISPSTTTFTDSSGSMEQTIGTKWIPIAGIILLIFGAGFFLKFAYENFNIPPVYRVILVAVCGLAALILGEITRRREYEIVAKSVTALGFGLLYASIFAANGHYNLIGSWPAMTFGVIVTGVAMLYAVVLDEIVMAFLSLLGGYLTPVIISTGEYLPVPLFGYLLVLAVGAMQCACFRKWRAVNMLSFAGTFILYTLWFEKFYQTHSTVLSYPYEMPAALAGLSIFFAVFLALPLLNGLKNKTKAAKDDVMLIVANSGVTFYYLYTILNPVSRTALAWAAILISAAYIGMMFAVRVRARDDRNLQAVLLAIGIVFFTLAMPLFFSMNILSVAWASQSAVVTFIGIRYRSRITQAGGLIALVLSCANLVYCLPMHNAEFRSVFNIEFGVWCMVAVSAYFNHLFYRTAARKPEQTFGIFAQWLYILMGVLLMAAFGMEWFLHCRYNLETESLHIITKGPVLILTAGLLGFIVYPVCPAGKIREGFAMLLAAAGSVSVVISLAALHAGKFTPYFNADIMPAYAFIAAVAVYHVLCRFLNRSDESKLVLSEQLYALAALLMFLTMAAEWFFYSSLDASPCVETLHSSLFFKGITVIFSAMILFTVMRPVSPLGTACKMLSAVLCSAVIVYTVGVFPLLHDGAFRMFFNVPFVFTCICVAALCAAGVLLLKPVGGETKETKLGVFFALSAIFILWAILTQEIYLYWYCLDKYSAAIPNWQFKAYMYISIMWAAYASLLMIAGFVTRVAMLRYIALGLFGLLLVKVFVIDTRQIENVFRIAAFIATGGVLVGVSYMYQFLKKKNFFENLPVVEAFGKNEDKI